MHRSNITLRARALQLAIGVCAIAALFTGATASARTRWWTRPVISGTPSTSDVAGTPYSFTPTAKGPSGYTLTFSISGKPAWASFNSANGRLSGTPGAANVGSSPNIVITVSDGVAHASLPSFNISVSAAAANTAPPTISGTPPAADNVGTAYSFTPTATDASGAALSFSVQNKPAWAAFSIATGALSGTPTAANVGTYSGIVISASDGTSSASLGPFSITVNQPAATSGTATLTWQAPVTNTDGSALTDLAGYHIYYGSSPSALTTVVDVANAGATTYTVNSLGSGTWYFAVNAYTTGGADSSLSNTGTKSIP